MPSIDAASVLILATDGFEQSELTEPLAQLRARGATVKVASPEHGEIRGWNKTDWGDHVPVDLGLDHVRPEDFDALVLPGGQINPDALRQVPEAVRLVRRFVDAGKTVAAICHGPWMLIEADVVRGRSVTSYPSIRTDLVNAGARWEDREVVADDGIITSRAPGDLDAFIAEIVADVEAGDRRRAA